MCLFFEKISKIEKYQFNKRMKEKIKASKTGEEKWGITTDTGKSRNQKDIL